MTHTIKISYPPDPAPRHYHSAHSIWLSVDPMADKYPGLSPYTYCANNPVKLVDPNGMDIWIVGDDGRKYQYKNGAIYYKGIEFTPSSQSYEAHVLKDLKVIANSKNEIIKQRLQDLETSKYKHIIKNSESRQHNFNYAEPENSNASVKGIGCGTTILFNSNNVSNYPDGASDYSPASLTHELIGHAWDNDKGLRSNDRLANGIRYNEVNAINTQNIILKEHNLKTRTQYGIDNNGFIEWKTIPSELLDSYFSNINND